MRKFNVTLFALVAAIAVLLSSCDDLLSSVHTGTYKNGEEIVFDRSNSGYVDYVYSGKIENKVFKCIGDIAITEVGPVTSFEDIKAPEEAAWKLNMELKENYGYVVKITHVFGSYNNKQFRMMVKFLDNGKYEVKYQEINKK